MKTVARHRSTVPASDPVPLRLHQPAALVVLPDDGDRHARRVPFGQQTVDVGLDVWSQVLILLCRREVWAEGLLSGRKSVDERQGQEEGRRENDHAGRPSTRPKEMELEGDNGVKWKLRRKRGYRQVATTLNSFGKVRLPDTLNLATCALSVLQGESVRQKHRMIQCAGSFSVCLFVPISVPLCPVPRSNAPLAQEPLQLPVNLPSNPALVVALAKLVLDGLVRRADDLGVTRRQTVDGVQQVEDATRRGSFDVPSVRGRRLGREIGGLNWDRAIIWKVEHDGQPQYV